MYYLTNSIIRCDFKVGKEAAMAGRNRLLIHLIGNYIFENAVFLGRVERLWLETGKGMKADFQEGNIYFGHKLRTVSLYHVKKRIEHIFFDEGY